MAEVLMPRLDPGMQSGKIVEWLKKEGELVQKGQPIVVIEGEKTTFEVEAPETGTLTKLLAAVGDDVQVSQPIAMVGSGSVSPPSKLETVKPQPSPTLPTVPQSTVLDQVAEFQEKMFSPQQLNRRRMPNHLCQSRKPASLRS